MIVVYCFCPKDEDIALKNAEWMLELGKNNGHEALVSYDTRCNPVTIEAVGVAMLKVFDKVWRLPVEAHIDGWPQGANHMFGIATAWLANKPQYPSFFWLEPDAIPLCEGWLDLICDEHTRSGKPFMGEKVDLGEKRPDVPVHMTGVGVYENPIHRHAGECCRAYDVAWDIAAKDQIMPWAHFTKLIQHYWQHGTFTSVDGIRPETVVFHSSKDGSLIDLMRQKRHDAIFPAPVLAEQRPSVPSTDGSDAGSGALESTTFDRPSVTKADSSGGERIKILPLSGIWVIDGDTIISDEVERYGRLDFDPLIPHILSLIRPGDTVVDVGAFIGDHTVAYSVAVGESGKVLAYEPNTLAFQCLIHNTGKLGNVFTFCHALGSEREVVELTDLPNAASNYIGAGGRHVHVRTLDEDASLFGRVDLIKIDVEGYELKVLRGAEQLINKFHPKLVIEINEIALERQFTTKDNIIMWLTMHGYKHTLLHQHDNAPFYDILCLSETETKSPEVAHPNSVVQDTRGASAERFPVVSSPPPPVIPLWDADPKKQMIDHVNWLKDFSEKNVHNRMLVMQRLTYAGLKTKKYKKKHP